MVIGQNAARNGEISVSCADFVEKLFFLVGVLYDNLISQLVERSHTNGFGHYQTVARKILGEDILEAVHIVHILGNEDFKQLCSFSDFERGDKVEHAEN